MLKLAQSHPISGRLVPFCIYCLMFLFIFLEWFLSDWHFLWLIRSVELLAIMRYSFLSFILLFISMAILIFWYPNSLAFTSAILRAMSLSLRLVSALVLKHHSKISFPTLYLASKATPPLLACVWQTSLDFIRSCQPEMCVLLWFDGFLWLLWSW